MDYKIFNLREIKVGKIFVDIRVVNIFDQSKKIETKALVDTGATFLSLPKREIEKLKLRFSRDVNVKTTNGIVKRKIYKGAEIIIQDRSVSMDILELPDDLPPLIGVLVLEALDFVVDPVNQKIMGNPLHKGEFLIDEL